MSRGMTPKEWAAYRGYAGAAWLARTLPERIGRRMFLALGSLAHATLAGVRTTVEGNQAQVLGLPADDPLVRAAGREAFALYARYWHDGFRAGLMSPEELNRRFVTRGAGNIDRALERGSGCICVLPHMGNWDVAGAWLAARYPGRAATVAEELKPPRLTELFFRQRAEYGLHVVTLSANGQVGRQLVRLLKDNYVLGLVADRDLTGRGIEVEMFGRPRRVPAGPALLSIKTGAPLLACPVRTSGRDWLCSMDPVDHEPSGNLKRDVEQITRRIAGYFERAIAEYPPDWHLFQRGWGVDVRAAPSGTNRVESRP